MMVHINHLAWGGSPKLLLLEWLAKQAKLVLKRITCYFSTCYLVHVYLNKGCPYYLTKMNLQIELWSVMPLSKVAISANM